VIKTATEEAFGRGKKRIRSRAEERVNDTSFTSKIDLEIVDRRTTLSVEYEGSNRSRDIGDDSKF